MLKRLSFNLVAFFLLLVTFGSQSSYAATLTLGSSSTSLGTQEIALPLDFTTKQGEEVVAFNLDINYNHNKLTFVEVEQDPTVEASGKTLLSSTPKPGMVRIIVFGLNEKVIAEGTVANLIFDVPESTSSGELNLSISNAVASDARAQKVALKTIDGSITIKETTKPSEVVEPAPVVEEEEEKDLMEFAQEEQEELEEKVVEEVDRELVPVAVPGAVVYREPQEQILEGLSEEELSQMKEILETYEESALLQPDKYPEEYQQAERPRIVIDEVKEIEEGLRIKKGGEVIKELTKQQAIIPKVELKQLKSILIWRLYKLELDQKGLQPILWHLKDEKKFPFLLKLNEEKGTIYGIVWGRKEVELDFVIITQDKQSIGISCKLKFK